jgi:hypothetical protein
MPTLAELLQGLNPPRRGTLGMLQQQQVAARPEPQGVLGMGLADALAQWGRGVQDKAAQFTPQNIATELSRLPKFDRNAAAQNVSPDAVNNMLSSNWMSFAPMGLGMIRAWHGSPHDIPLGRSFDASKIGTGEGAQAYGHGFYAAENKGVAAEYQKQLAKDGFFVNGMGVFDPQKSLSHLNIKTMVYKGDLDGAIKKATEIVKDGGSASSYAKSDLEKLLEIKANGGLQKNNGYMYPLELTHPNPAKEAATPLSPQDFLHWDLPLSQQPEGVKDFVKNNMQENIAYAQAAAKKIGSKFDPMENMTGKDVYSWMVKLGNQEKASKLLNQAGIPGIRYLDGGSRGAGQGTYNYVLFDPKLANIVGKE